MIKEIHIQNFKSVSDLTLKLGRVTVIIGENGSGKSNLLEGIGFAAASVAGKLDNAYLFARGIRDTSPEWMLPAFSSDGSEELDETGQKVAMQFSISCDEVPNAASFSISPRTNKEDGSFASWETSFSTDKNALEAHQKRLLELGTDGLARAREILDTIFEAPSVQSQDGVQSIKETFYSDPIRAAASLIASIEALEGHKGWEKTDWFSQFIIFAPENTTLRTPPPEGAAQPLGTKGEGLFRLLQSFSDSKFADRLQDLKERLHLFGWFDDFTTPDESSVTQAKLQIKDRWLSPDRPTFDQRSANEGFLYLLFYFTALMSWRTPKFFALDNVDNALNPRLCVELMRQICQLAVKYDKQVICTTHNPAILDGLDLSDDSQRLYTVKRDSSGRTAVRRVLPPRVTPNQPPIRLSEAFMKGLIGGLPEHF